MMRIGKIIYFAVILFVSVSPESWCQSVKYWVYFKDKGNHVLNSGNYITGKEETKRFFDYIHPRALARRAKIAHKGNLLDEADRPVHEFYLNSIAKIGGTPVQKSRWFNAASFILTPALRKKVISLPFVSRVEPVKVFSGKDKYSAIAESTAPLYEVLSLDYGSSYDQLRVPNIIQLHDAGITGHRVIIGILDSGYRWKLHEALQDRRVLAEYDFIFNDDNTANEPGDPQVEDSHGTLTFSVVGGYKPGKLVGAAFDSEFLLAKTEYDSTEFQSEEDFWVAGIEWLEGLGADVISSSLGYDLFDDGTGYFWENGDFDGRTSITARAAAHAARLGVVVCTAMGNEGNGDGITGTLLTPGDADSILSVGAVAFNGRLASFSSTGPTNDGRTKPDIVAPGVNVYHARVPGPDTYGRSQGTSLATPITAGTSALLLSVRPELTPIEVRDILKATAEPTDTGAYRPVPNNFTGWGLINAFQAAASLGPVFSNSPTVTINSDETILTTFVFSKYGINPDSTLLYYSAGSDDEWTRIHMTLDSSVQFPTSGRYTATLPSMLTGTPIRFYISALDSTGRSYTSPSPSHIPYWIYYSGSGNIRDTQPLPAGYLLEQNYPNPFNYGTWIQYSLPHSEYVSLKVYNVVGQLVAVLVDGFQNATGNLSRFVYFDASNLPSGVYFYRLASLSYSSTKKMMLLR